MYKTLLVSAADSVTATKQVNSLFKELNLATWQIKNFSPVHEKEIEFKPGTPQYKVIVLLTADQVKQFAKAPADQVKKPAAKKAAPKKPTAKKAAAKKPAAIKAIAPAKDSAAEVKKVKPGK